MRRRTQTFDGKCTASVFHQISFFLSIAGKYMHKYEWKVSEKYVFNM